MLAITGLAPPSALRKTLIRSKIGDVLVMTGLGIAMLVVIQNRYAASRSVAGRHLDVAFYDDVGRRIGDGDRRLGDAANPLQRIPESTGTSPRPVQGR